ncbi:MAG: ATPase, T2SS/T4P/T4SS family [Lachnospiraceae bacterium]
MEENLCAEQWLEELINYFTKIEKHSLSQVERGQKSRKAFLGEAYEYLRRRSMPEKMIPPLLEQFAKYIWGYHVLEELIEDESISDIKVLNYNNIRVKRYGKRENSHVKFSDRQAYRQFVEYVAAKNKTSISDIHAVQNFTDKTSNSKFILRFNISTEFVNSVEVPYLHIRKIPKKKRTIEELQQIGMMSEEVMEYLKKKAEEATGILFSGKGASGKTTLMNAMLDCIPHDKSGLIIQENEELFSHRHPDLMFQHVVQTQGEGRISYDLKELARNGLLVDLDYFVIGEIKGGEALYFLNACYTGHRCWASVHGADSRQAIDKLADYVKYESDYAKADVMKMLSGLNCIVFMEEFRVKEISEVTGFSEKDGILEYRRIY